MTSNTAAQSNIWPAGGELTQNYLYSFMDPPLSRPTAAKMQRAHLVELACKPNARVLW